MTAGVLIEEAGIDVSIGYLSAVRDHAEGRPCHGVWPTASVDCFPLCEHLVRIAGVNRGIAITMEHDRGDDLAARARSWGSALPPSRGRPSVLHRGERGGEIVGGAVGEAGVDADGGIEVRVAHPHDHRHRPAGRQPGYVHPPSIEVVGAHDLARDVSDDRRFATTPVLVGRLEPIPTLGLVSRGRLCGIDDEEPFLFCENIHPGAGGEIVRGLRTAMQHDDQRQGLPAISTGDV